MTNLKPLRDMVLLKPIVADDKTSGGILLPQGAQEKPVEATIVACGPGKPLEDGTYLPLDVKVGDRCIYSKYATTEVKDEGETLLLIQEANILAVIGEPNDSDPA